MPEIEKSTEAYNVALGYVNLKILKPLYETDILVRKALYGTDELNIDNFQLPHDLIINIRIEAIYRLIDVLREIIENSHFACKKEFKKQLDELEEGVLCVLDVIDGIASEQTDMRSNSKKTIINEKHFNTCLEELRAIKKEIAEPLNRSGLIFPQSEDFDIDRIKQRLIHGG